MIKGQVYAGIGLALIGIMLFILVSPLLYLESPIGVHVEGRSKGVVQMAVNQSFMVPLNVTNPYIIVGYNYTSGPIEVALENSSASVSPIGVELGNRTVSLS
ncbi:MAG: hypothetical protein QW613_05775, partial [Thermoprotei archaeon]